MKSFNNDIDALVYIVTYHAEPRTSPMLTVIGSDKVYTYEYAGVRIPWGKPGETNVVPFPNKDLVVKKEYIMYEEKPCTVLNSMLEWELGQEIDMGFYDK